MDVSDRSSLPRRASHEDRAALPGTAVGLAPLDPSFWQTVDDGLRLLDLELSVGVRAALDAHVRLLRAWNEHVNLSGLRSPEQIARGHVLDSLLAVASLRGLGRARPSILDLGSGAGYPGLPLALALPARRAALVDSIAKKAAFLEVAVGVVIDALRGAPGTREAEVPSIDVLAERSEDLADEPDQRETWDLVTARAVGSVAEVAELGLPLVRRGGHVAIWKHLGASGELQREVGAAARVIGAAGGGAARVMALPGAERLGLTGHCLVVIDKRHPTPDRYPRSPGERRRRALT